MRPGSNTGPTFDLPTELADNPVLCVRFPKDPASSRTLMSDRGAEFALSIGPDGVLVGYVFKSPVWLPVGDGEYSTPAFLQTGSSVMADTDRKHGSRLAIGDDKPPAALLRGLLGDNPSDTRLNRGQRGGS